MKKVLKSFVVIVMSAVVAVVSGMGVGAVAPSYLVTHAEVKMPDHVAVSGEPSVAVFSAKESRVTYQIKSAPKHGTLTVDSETGLVTYTSEKGYVGKDNYILQCQNQTGEASDRLIVKVKVVSADTVKVACVGDSITWGVGSADINVNYPILLEEKLGEGYVVANFGISATSMIEKAGNGYSTRVSYDFSLAMLPDIVIIMLGTNDANLGIWNTRKAQFYDDCIKMIEAYQKLPSHPDVYVATSPYVKETIATISENTVKNEVNPLQRQAAEAMGCGLIDIHAVTEGHPEYFYDGVHPNETGYPVIAEAMYQGLQNSQDRKAAGMTVKTVAEYDYLISGAYLLEEDTNTSTEPPMSTSKDTTSDSTLITQEVQSKSASAFRLMPYLTGAAVVLMAEALVAIIMMLCKKNKA